MMGMTGGARFEKGSFTVPLSVTSYTINLSKSYNNYVIIIEADATSKQQIIDSGTDRVRSFFYMCIYPNREIKNKSISNNMFSIYIYPSNDVTGGLSDHCTMTENSITFGVSGLTSAGNMRLYNGLTYNYYIVEIK